MLVLFDFAMDNGYVLFLDFWQHSNVLQYIPRVPR